MTKAKQSGSFKGHRFPPEIIAYAVWAYCRFAMSFRDVEDLLAERGVIVSHETIRKWVQKFGPKYAKAIRRARPAPSDKWHLDEVVIPIRGVKYWLWRAVDSNGDVLDILLQSRRNTRAADRFFRKLFKQFGQPRVVITDKLGSYGAALKKIAPGLDHRSHKGLNNRSEGSHRPTRRREKIMGRFKSPGQAQRFLATHDQVQIIFRPRRHTLSATSYRHARTDAHAIWGFCRKVSLGHQNLGNYSIGSQPGALWWKMLGGWRPKSTKIDPRSLIHIVAFRIIFCVKKLCDRTRDGLYSARTLWA